jgi:hypothetical protein
MTQCWLHEGEIHPCSPDDARCSWPNHLHHDPETCLRCNGAAGGRLSEAVERIRAHHDKTLGHSWTNRVGYCAEPDGISATYCETGILLSVIP